MGNSTISGQDVIDFAKAKGIPVPTSQPGGYGTKLAMKMLNDTMSQIVAKRFNWKWNQAIAVPFYTNSYQQDYPQIGLTDIGWLENADRVDINNTSFPKPLRQMTVVRGLPRTSDSFVPSDQICWLYNKELSYGTWPGVNKTFNPLVTSQVQQNPIMSMIDANGNRLILTTFGITGASAPVLPAASLEGVTVVDGSCVWTVVSGESQGFRVYPLPGATGPVWQITPYYQVKLVLLPTLQAAINPIPDEYSQTFQEGFEIACKRSSANPQDRAEGDKNLPLWFKAMMDAAKQGDKEKDAYAMLPATSPVDDGWGRVRNPQDPSQPY